MTATIRELKRAMFNTNSDLIINTKEYTNSEGRFLLFDIKNQDLEVDFYIGSAGVFVVEAELLK